MSLFILRRAYFGSATKAEIYVSATVSNARSLTTLVLVTNKDIKTDKTTIDPNYTDFSDSITITRVEHVGTSDL